MSSRPPLDAWRRRFVRNITLLALGLQTPAALGVGCALRRAGAGVAASSALVAALLVLVNLPLWYRLLWWRDSARASALRVWLVEAPYATHLCAALFSGFFGWLALALHGALAALGVDAARALGPERYLLPLHGFALALGVYSVFVRRLWVRVVRVRVRVANLPPALEGYTLAQLSDVHCGPHLPRWFLRSIAARTVALGARAVVLTGDMITDGTGYLDDVRELVSLLRAPDGVFAVLGNHDYFGTTEGVAVAMAEGGATVLRNEATVLAPERGGGVFLAGVDDLWTKRCDVARALRERAAHAEKPCVLLAHDPESFDAVAARGDVDLVLSGHTHAGQLALPFAPAALNLAQLRYGYTSGLYRKENCTLFVHQGLGVSGPPGRLGAAPEIALLELTRA